MINWIQKLIPGKRKKSSLSATVIPRPDHIISRKAISKNALTVLYRLNDHQHEAYLVGGCVRDLLLGLKPKDFDVATDASPERVKRVFNNCRLIGRRFRLAHVYFGRDIIEVATFRADATKRTAKHKKSDQGMLLRDNVFGTIEEDALRRDFTVNALYYRVTDFAIVDFCNGMADIEARTIRLIGDPVTRYHEDPVRMLRAARFAAKLQFTLHADTHQPIPTLSHLLRDVPSARLFEESLKLFMSGHAVASFDWLNELGLFTALFPVTESYTKDDLKMIRAGLQDTDTRIARQQTTSPGYLFAVLFWPIYRAGNEDCFRDINAFVAIPKRITQISYGIWDLQYRLENVKRHQVGRLLSHPGFRAAFDFLCLRAEYESRELSGMAQWWEKIQRADDESFKMLCEHLPQGHKKRRRRKKRDA